ncbi:MAG: hypothetical protein K2J25_05640 [Oscillospiraceae bacterium]|nr:hypothetical protein [Oscillospiraceae bacterium]
MMKKKAIPKKLKGTVLFTVVSVMMVLIVFLVATLALASTASKRAYTNYQQEQAEYTARAVIEAVTREIEADVNSLFIRADIVNYNDTPGDTDTINVQIDDGAGSVETYPVTIVNTGEQRAIYDASSGWQNLDVYRLSVTVDSATTTAEATYETFIGLKKIISPGTQNNQNSGGDGGAFVSLGDTGGTEIATHGYTTGGTYLGIGVTGYDYHMSAGGDITIDAPFYVNGNLHSPTQFIMHFTKPNDFMVVRGDFSAQNDNIQTSFAGYTDATTTGGSTYENTPYIYVEGKLSAPGSKFKFGESAHAVNLYCGSLEVGQNGFEMWGDIYLMDEGVESVLKSSGASTKLYKWSGATFTRDEGYDTQYGNIYSMGSLKVEDNNGLIVDGNVQINEDLTVSNLTVTGDVVVNGTLTVTGTLNANSVIATNVIGGTINATNGVKAVTSTVPFTAIDTSALTSKGDRSIKTWYTDVWIDPNGENQWADGKGYMKVNYIKHTEIDGVAQPDETVNNQDIVAWTEGLDPTAFPSFAAYAATVNDIANDIQTYTSDITAKTEIIPLGYDLSGIYGREIYPSGYTKTKLNEVDPVTNKSKIENPQASNYESMYPISVNNLDTTIYDGGYKVPVYGNGSLTYSSLTGTYGIEELDPPDVNGNKKNYYTVTANCVLNGYFEKNVYIDGSAGDITVVLDNVSFSGNTGASIIVNDTNNVTLFIVGTLTLGASGQGTSIITTDYLDLFKGLGNWSYTDNLKGVMGSLQNDVQIEQVQQVGNDKYPNVTIHSDDNATLSVPENGLVVGLVRAPKLIYNSGQARDCNKTIAYELPTGEIINYGANRSINVTGTQAVGLIGQLIAGKIQLSSNGNWGMLYITDPTTNQNNQQNQQQQQQNTPATESIQYTMLYGNMY